MNNKDEQLRNTYRNLKIYIKDDKVIKTKRSVSFDTVPQIVGESSVQKDKMGLQLPLTLQLQYHSKFNDVDKIFYIGKNGKYIRRDYPSRPTILADSLVISKEFGNWHNNWHNKLSEIQKLLILEKDGQIIKPWNNPYFKYPKILFPREPYDSFICNDDLEPYTKEERRKLTVIHKKIKFINEPRIILCHITGRRHTWVALDWLLHSNFLHDCDHLVILTNLPAFRHCAREKKQRKDSKQQQNGNDFIDDDPYREQWGHHQMYPKELINEVCYDIIEYINVLFNKNPLNLQKSLKITIDMTIGKTKQAFIDAINIYQPNLIFISTLKWERYDKLIVKRSNYLKDVMTINLHMPVIILPVKRMWKLELSLGNEDDLVENEQNVENGINANQLDQKSVDTLQEITNYESSNVSIDSLNTGINPFPKKEKYQSYVSSYLRNLLNSANNNSSSSNDENYNLSDKNEENDVPGNSNNNTSIRHLALTIDKLPTITQIYLTAKKYRFLMKSEITQLNETANELDKIKTKLDIIIKNSLLGSKEIDEITESEQKIRDELRYTKDNSDAIKDVTSKNTDRVVESSKSKEYNVSNKNLSSDYITSEDSYYNDSDSNDDDDECVSVQDEKNGFLKLKRVITGGTPIFISSQIADIQDATTIIPPKKDYYPIPLSGVYKETLANYKPQNITFASNLKVKKNQHTLGNQSMHSSNGPKRRSIDDTRSLKKTCSSSSDNSCTSQKTSKSESVHLRVQDFHKNKSKSLPTSRRNSNSKEQTEEKPKSSIRRLSRLFGFK